MMAILQRMDIGKKQYALFKIKQKFQQHEAQWIRYSR
jgi:hypothetical protein